MVRVHLSPPCLTKIEPRKRVGFRFVFYTLYSPTARRGLFHFVCFSASVFSLGDGFMPRKTLDTSRGCGRLSRHRQTNSPSGLGGWLLCLAPTLPRGSCQEYRGINRQRVLSYKHLKCYSFIGCTLDGISFYRHTHFFVCDDLNFVHAFTSFFVTVKRLADIH